VGVLPRLVHSRFGLHVVEVLAREPGTQPDFEVVRSAVAQSLRQQSYATALRQYLSLLAGQPGSKASTWTPPTRRWCSEARPRPTTRPCPTTC
jgi:hypothetical protein